MFRRSAWALCVLAVLLLTACARMPNGPEGMFLLSSEEQELAMGERDARTLLLNEKQSADALRAGRVRRVGQRLAAVAGRPEYVWEFHLLERNLVGSLCLPGGKVFVYAATMELAASDDELAAVMGHEIAHALLRHYGERMALIAVNYGMLGPSAREIFAPKSQPEEGGNLALQQSAAASVRYSPRRELEADELGMTLAAKAGFEPVAALVFWCKADAAAKAKGPTASNWMPLHPIDEARLTALAAKAGPIREASFPRMPQPR